MAPITIDVDAQIDNLSGLKGDLDECFWTVDEADSHTRYALGIAVAQLSHRIAALEEVVRHHGGGERVTVGDLGLEESRALDRALRVLDGELVLEASKRVDRLWARVRLVLGAADDVLLAVARGHLTRAVGDDDTGPRPGVVLPLIRSDARHPVEWGQKRSAMESPGA